VSVINFVLSGLEKRKFGGGQWCVVQYAQGLAERGHDVMIIPMLPSPLPDWFPNDQRFQYVAGDRLKTNVAKRLVGTVGKTLCYPFTRNKVQLKTEVQCLISELGFLQPGALPFELWRALSLVYVRQNMRPSNVTIATSFETALPVALSRGGEKMYFMQHFEPYFFREKLGVERSRLEALASYRFGLRMIANSTWLKGMVEREVPGIDVDLCTNAINHEYFQRKPTEKRRSADEIIIISYGGRKVAWKGFKEMAEAVHIARERSGGVDLRWQVYGDADLPPNNTIASYEQLGFLHPKVLGEAYRQADILLSASWYESFPLFPLEAMACGLPVITTEPGTEDYAIDGETAILVKPKDPEDIAQGILRLVNDPALREAVAQNGWEASQRFTWRGAIDRMEGIIAEAIKNT
jgi:glycosyltransferase involved in cell wall biosynthesis